MGRSILKGQIGNILKRLRRQYAYETRNSFQGKVTGIMPKASVVEIILDVGFPLSIDITRKSFEELGVSEGDTLWATFKVSAIKVFEH